MQLTQSKESFIAEAKNVKGNRRHSISGSHGVNEAHRYYLKQGGTLTRGQFGKVIRYIDRYYKEELASGRNIKLPCGMGILSLRKTRRGIKQVNGKITTTYPVDWDATLKLWYEDQEAREKKQLVKSLTDTVFRVVYPPKNRKYINSKHYGFMPGRGLKIRLKEKVKEGNVDAFLSSDYEARYS